MVPVASIAQTAGPALQEYFRFYSRNKFSLKIRSRGRPFISYSAKLFVCSVKVHIIENTLLGSGVFKYFVFSKPNFDFAFGFLW